MWRVHSQLSIRHALLRFLMTFFQWNKSVHQQNLLSRVSLWHASIFRFWNDLIDFSQRLRHISYIYDSDSTRVDLNRFLHFKGWSPWKNPPWMAVSRIVGVGRLLEISRPAQKREMFFPPQVWVNPMIFIWALFRWRATFFKPENLQYIKFFSLKTNPHFIWNPTLARL